MYLARYPRVAPERCLLISNGYDEQDFLALDLRKAAAARRIVRLRVSTPA